MLDAQNWNTELHWLLDDGLELLLHWRLGIVASGVWLG